MILQRTEIWNFLLQSKMKDGMRMLNEEKDLVVTKQNGMVVWKFVSSDSEERFSDIKNQQMSPSHSEIIKMWS